MAYISPFYHTSNSPVSSRAGAYGDTGFRNDNILKWLYRKIAYVTAEAYNEKNGRSSSLYPPTGGGIDVGGVYTAGGSDGRRIPVPTIESATISTEGDLGSILKCELKFTVFGLKQLDACSTFFDPGAILTVDFGWSVSGGYGGPPESFRGTIYNFTYSVRQGGGFDCTTYAMSAATNALAVTAKASSGGDGSYKDPLDNDVPANDVMGVIEKYVTENKTAKIATNTTGTNEVGMIEIAETYEPKESAPASGGSSTAAAAKAAKGTAQAQFYISLRKVVEVIRDKVLKKGGGPQMAKFKIVCDKTVTKGSIPTSATDLVSANPLECVFPGFGDYGASSKYDFSSSTLASEFKSNDLSAIMINTTWLSDTFKKLGMKTGDRSRSADPSVSQFLKNIFDMIYQNSGTRFQLSCVQDITDKTGQTFIITDINYVPTQVSPLVLTAVTNGGFCRSLSLSAKVPSEMQAAAYVGNKSTAAGTSGEIGKATGRSNPPTYSTATADLASAKNSVEKSGFNENVINQLRSALRGIFITSPGKDHGPLYPLSLSATMDGVWGFAFGDAVTTNYLPSQYRGSVAFAVTKVTHQVGGGDWTTTIDTVCRLLP